MVARRPRPTKGSRLPSARAALIGRLAQRDDATWLAEPLIEIETDPDDITRLRLVDGPQRAIDGGES